ncbi:glycosyltransferase family 8 protein [Aplosporella prunicola CBS 121167]|uniref:glycogenin glucosyltransferase n=1 Tax=Aplosporella prunicola CBS 121167 TaxID=1176127 RepID=A0A6A6B6V3_9PEZI|nr:glycosyltransferase family 8 protein [Aplosporella prunicola CBS 121167]KAF2139616.1 glycosyltransferase family 8 protein [Aplosporella prunicola CBS 121167]
MAEDAYCTLVMSDSYLPGASVLAHSLRDAGTTKKLAALITLDTLSADTITELKELYDHLIPVQRIGNPHPGNLYLMDRGDLAYTFTKIALWKQIQFRKIVYIDADVVALRAPDELFAIEAPFAAAPDVGWPDAFNSGVMVLSPNMGDFWALQTLASSGDSFDGADQGLLNQYYEHRNWHRISFAYNCTPNAQYQWEPAYKYYKSNISMVHFIGRNKPWSRDNRPSGGAGVYNELLAKWWAVYDRHLKAKVRQCYGALQHVESKPGRASHGTGIPHMTTSTTTETPLTDPAEPAQNTGQDIAKTAPMTPTRKFSAPQMEWDATRSAPPSESRPEASNFPSETYTFSESKELFQAPVVYPEPPKDMWYEVPKTKPKVSEEPKPIFPWETERPKARPTRVFAEDAPQPKLEPQITPEPLAVSQKEEPISQASTATTPPEDPWQSFGQSKNAWDSVPGIERYVRAVLGAQTKKARPSSLSLESISQSSDILSPTGEGDKGKERHESLILTDFPTAVERPSLPVTPAPIRRPTFWGEEKSEKSQLPSAEGVPDQAEWVCPHCGYSSNDVECFRRERRRSPSPLQSEVSRLSAASTAADSGFPFTYPVSAVQKAELPMHITPVA